MAEDTQVFDLSGAFDDLFDLEREMETLSGVTVPRNAEAMADTFEAAGLRIEEALSRAARTGEINFENLISSVLADLARLGVGAVLDQVIGSIGGASGVPPVSVNITMPEGATSDGIFAAQGQIAAAVSQVIASGARWS